MPDRIAKYEVLRRLGQGAMGEVYLARDPLIGREVAIKTIASAHAQGEEARERFLREARAAGTLGHPNLVTIHEFGEDQGLLYLVMEYVPGEDLHALIAARALQPKEFLEVLAQVCDGLGFAHGKGVLHRDIKPSNIRVARPGGRLLAKVMDFGIARISGSDFTGTGTLLGTFGYMAPEYIQTGRPDPRSDLFAVGVMLYEALTGDRPFQGDTTATILYRIVHDSPPPLEPQHIHGISPAIGTVLAMALAKEPADRFATAEAMAAALRAAIAPTWRGLGPGAVPHLAGAGAAPTEALRAGPTRVEPAPGPRRLGPWIGAGLAAAAAVSALALWPRKPEIRPVEPVAAAVVGVRPPVVPPPAEAAVPPSSKPVEPKTVQPSALQTPAAVEAPAPGPAEPPPRLPPRPATLDEAAALVDRDPKAALAFLERFLVQDPRNPRAWMLKLVACYELGDVERLKSAIRDAREHGLQRRSFLVFPRFRAMIRQETEHPKLPPGFREQLLEDLRPPGDGEPKGRPFKRRPF